MWHKFTHLRRSADDAYAPSAMKIMPFYFGGEVVNFIIAL